MALGQICSDTFLMRAFAQTVPLKQLISQADESEEKTNERTRTIVLTDGLIRLQSITFNGKFFHVVSTSKYPPVELCSARFQQPVSKVARMAPAALRVFTSCSPGTLGGPALLLNRPDRHSLVSYYSAAN